MIAPLAPLAPLAAVGSSDSATGLDPAVTRNVLVGLALVLVVLAFSAISSR